jgi:hypothetical protein
MQSTMTSIPVSQSGFLYAVSNDTEALQVKCGFTRHECPEEYLQKYALTMPSLHVIAIQPCARPGYGEQVLFETLAEYRMHTRHEVFLVPSLDVIRSAFACASDADAAGSVQRGSQNRL